VLYALAKALSAKSVPLPSRASGPPVAAELYSEDGVITLEGVCTRTAPLALVAIAADGVEYASPTALACAGPRTFASVEVAFALPAGRYRLELRSGSWRRVIATARMTDALWIEL
jgi:hypothetical protein